jgi:cobaltochelatase CobN
MHLLAATSAVIGEGDEAIDLAQTPAEVIVLSAADTELAALAAARRQLGEAAPSLRLAPLGLLRHNMSVDLWVEKTARHARLIIARVLGGAAYWPYGIEELERLAREEGIHTALLPGGQVLDEALTRRSSLPPETCEAIRALLAAGGVENARRLLLLARDILAHGPLSAKLPAPHPLPAAGLWLNGRIRTDATTAAPLGNAAPSPRAWLVFYRALLEGGFTAPVEALTEALEEQGLSVLPLFVTSPKSPPARRFMKELARKAPPDVIVSLTAFSAGEDDVLRAPGCPVIQAITAGCSQEAWRENPQGLGPRDLAMHVALPELDGRVIGRAISFKQDTGRDEATQCPLLTYAPAPERIRWTAALAARWARLRSIPPQQRRIAFILANYPNRDARLGNGVGLDVPASTLNILHALRAAGYDTGSRLPDSGDALMKALAKGPTNDHARNRRMRRWQHAGGKLTHEEYLCEYNKLEPILKKQVEDRWGPPENDPFFHEGAFHLPLRRYGNILVAIQPARGYNIDPAATYHDPALVPPHGYLAFYMWLREHFEAHAIVHVGKHGNLEWLPGKALALSSACFPDAVLGPLPHLYPFIVNDPGEGAQAKRRTQAVIVDHLTPPLARAGTYGPLAELERLLDEYWQAATMDSRRLAPLRRDILDLARSAGIDRDAGIDDADTAGEEEALIRLDAFLCEIKEAQIRNGLHILGELPPPEALAELVVALVRLPRGEERQEDASLIAALARDLGLTGSFDPLAPDSAAPWQGPRPSLLARMDDNPWRTCGDTRERLERLSLALVRALPGISSGRPGPDPGQAKAEEQARAALAAAGAAPERFPRTMSVLAGIIRKLLPALGASARNEIAHLLAGLNGRLVPPGPAGAPTRGRLDVLPTGRNFYSLDPRVLPTPAAWELGRKSAENMLLRHFQEQGEYPRAIGLSCWGTANMRTGGDDIAQALALMGVRPVWDHGSGRVTGFQIIPLAELGRPRVDVTLRISGFFRDAFPRQIELFDRAVRAVAALDEPEEDNPLAARVRAERRRFEADGLPPDRAERLASYRVFSAPPGAYGAGLQALFDERLWETPADLAETWIRWGAHAYGGEEARGEHAEEAFRRRLSALDAVAHNQDNREHDILDSDDYYQFEGGMAAAVKHLKGRSVPVWHNDHADPSRPRTRSLEEEVARVMRARVVNPRWIAAMRRHGYKGAFEMAATVDYMFAFAATTGAVKDHHFEMVYEAFLADEETRDWLAEANPEALRDIAERLEEALARGFWKPRSNSAPLLLECLRAQDRTD